MHCNSGTSKRRLSVLRAMSRERDCATAVVWFIDRCLYLTVRTELSMPQLNLDFDCFCIVTIPQHTGNEPEDYP